MGLDQVCGLPLRMVLDYVFKKSLQMNLWFANGERKLDNGCIEVEIPSVDMQNRTGLVLLLEKDTGSK